MHIARIRIPRPPARLALSAATGAWLLLGATPAARAGDIGGIGASCTNTPAACTLSAQSPGNQGTGTAPGKGSTKPGRGPTGGPPPAIACTDAPYQVTAQNAGALKAAQPKGPGHWVIRTCSGPALAPTRMLTWIPGGGRTLPDPRVLAVRALSKLSLPKPVIHSSPGGAVPQTVQLPTWAWLPKAQWARRSATASVPGESVTATATPLSVTWSWGDGTSTVCQGPGAAYVKGVSDPGAPSPDCGHTYRQTSAAGPNRQYPITATLAWAVAWSGAGQFGTFPNLTTTATTHWTVRQIQSLIVNQ
ncbi:MAG: hypothetical protein ACRDRL_11010 [Sciscionella sp.]